MSGETRAHYDRLAGTYDENWAHSLEFIDWMADRILERLDLQPGDHVVDLGCGTGLYTRYLAEHVDQVVCVDPSAKMLEQLPPGDAFIPVRASAEEIVSGAVPLPPASLPIDSIVVKEAIHHAVDQAVWFSAPYRSIPTAIRPSVSSMKCSRAHHRPTGKLPAKSKEMQMGRHDDKEEKCADCGGDGGWNVTLDGKTVWEDCAKCKGTGKA